MSDDQKATDTQLIAEAEERREEYTHRQFWLLIAAVLGAMGIRILYHFAIQYGMGDNWHVRAFLEQGLLPVLLMVAIFSNRYKGPVLPTRLLRQQIDDVQERRHDAVMCLLLVLFATTLGMSCSAKSLLASSDIGMPIGIIFLVMVVVTALAVLNPGPKVFDDEWVSALRARSGLAGFVGLLLALSAAFPIVVYHPDWAVQAFIWTLFVGGATPALYYVIADWRAGREK